MPANSLPLLVVHTGKDTEFFNPRVVGTYHATSDQRHKGLDTIFSRNILRLRVRPDPGSNKLLARYKAQESQEKKNA